MKISALTLALATTSLLLARAAPIDFISINDIEVRNEEHRLEARWGSGKYVVDDDTYHRQLKPAIISKFKEHDPKFTSKCGNNPDFMVERSGSVYPEPQKAKAKACPKNRFTLDLGALIQSYQKAQSPSPSPERSPSPSPEQSSSSSPKASKSVKVKH